MTRPIAGTLPKSGGIPAEFGFSSEHLKRLCEFGAHLSKMVLVFDFAVRQTVNDMDVYCGARFRKPDFLLMGVFLSHNTFAVQCLEGFRDLTETAVELRECLINLWFHGCLQN